MWRQCTRAVTADYSVAMNGCESVELPCAPYSYIIPFKHGRLKLYIKTLIIPKFIPIIYLLNTAALNCSRLRSCSIAARLRGEDGRCLRRVAHVDDE